MLMDVAGCCWKTIKRVGVPELSIVSVDKKRHPAFRERKNLSYLQKPGFLRMPEV